MTVRPIIFSAPMVKALLAGNKHQTRRLATSPLRKCEPGDLLYVRETFRHWRASASGKTAVYSADDRWIDWGSGENFVEKVQWLTPATPSIHMPRWASRLTLRVDAVRVERLQSISKPDAIAEGIERVEQNGLTFWQDYLDFEEAWSDPRTSYRSLWEKLHGRDSWLSDPDVLVLSFAVIEDNVDRLAA